MRKKRRITVPTALPELRLWLNKHGGYRPLAKTCKVSWQTVQKWLTRGVVPVRHIAPVATVTQIPRYLLNEAPFREVELETEGDER